MARRKIRTENYRKFTFDISESNYAYLIELSKSANMKIGTFLDFTIGQLKADSKLINDAVTYSLLTDKIALLEKNIQQQNLLLEEMNNFKKKLSKMTK